MFDKTRLICTDRIQTPQGQRFWVSVVEQAINLGFYVYYVDFNTPRVYAHIDSIKKFHEYDNKGLIWTAKQKGEAQLLLISENPLPKFHKD